MVQLINNGEFSGVTSLKEDSLGGMQASSLNSPSYSSRNLQSQQRGHWKQGLSWILLLSPLPRRGLVLQMGHWPRAPGSWPWRGQGVEGAGVLSSALGAMRVPRETWAEGVRGFYCAWASGSWRWMTRSQMDRPAAGKRQAMYSFWNPHPLNIQDYSHYTQLYYYYLKYQKESTKCLLPLSSSADIRKSYIITVIMEDWQCIQLSTEPIALLCCTQSEENHST